MNNKILINQTVAILCDGNNIERSIHEESGNKNTMINFDKIIPKLLSTRGLNRLIYFREGQNISSKLAERLHENYYGSVVPCHKSADIPLSIKATQLASKVDTIIIMSGDSDYVDLVRHLKSEGVRVEIAAVPKTTARILKEEADYFHAITREHWFFYNSPVRRSFHKDSRPVKSSEPVTVKLSETVIVQPTEPVKEDKKEVESKPIEVKKTVEVKKEVKEKTSEVKKETKEKPKSTHKKTKTVVKKPTAPPKMKGAKEVKKK